MSEPTNPALSFFYRWFLFLVFAQTILVLSLMVFGPEAPRRADRFPASADVQCGDDRDELVDLELSFPPASLHCEGEDCSHSRYVQDLKDLEDPHELHIVAVEGAVQGERRGGGWPRVEVRVQESTRPMILVLSSKEHVQWDLKGVGDSNLHEVHVVTPRASRLTGLHEKPEVGLFWHGSQVICVHPFSWAEADNPNNEYQRFLKSLRTLLKQSEVSFQGSSRARSFRVPYYDDLESELAHVRAYRDEMRGGARALASVLPTEIEGLVVDIHNQGLVERGWGKIPSKGGEPELLEEIPRGRRLLDRRADGKYHLLTDGVRLLLFDPKNNKDVREIEPPEDLGHHRRLHLASFHEGRKTVRAYYQDRGGVVKEWSPLEGKWRDVFSLHRVRLDEWLWQGDELWALRVERRDGTLMKFDASGAMIYQEKFFWPKELASRRSRGEMKRWGGDFLFKHHSSSAPWGHWFLLKRGQGEVLTLPRSNVRAGRQDFEFR